MDLQGILVDYGPDDKELIVELDRHASEIFKKYLLEYTRIKFGYQGPDPDEVDIESF